MRQKSESRIGIYPSKINEETVYNVVRVNGKGEDLDIEFFNSQLSQDELSSYLKRNSDSIVTGVVPSLQSFSRIVTLPPVPENKVHEIVQFEAAQQIPFDLNEVCWDYMLMSPKDSPEKIVKISAVKKEVCENLFPFKGVKTIIDELSVLPLMYQNPSINSRSLGDMKKNLEVIIAIGDEYTNLVFCKKGVDLWRRTIIIGYNAIGDIFKGLAKSHESEIDGEYKEATLKEQAMQTFAKDLKSEIKRSFGFYFSNNSDSKIKSFITPNQDEALLEKINLEYPDENETGPETKEDVPLAELADEDVKRYWEEEEILHPKKTDTKLQEFKIEYKAPFEMLKRLGQDVEVENIREAYALAGAFYPRNWINLTGERKIDIEYAIRAPFGVILKGVGTVIRSPGNFLARIGNKVYNKGEDLTRKTK